MNENGFSILMVGVMVAGMLGSILRYRRSRAIEAGESLKTQPGGIQKEPSLLPSPASKRSSVILFSFVSLLVIMWGLMLGFMVGALSNILYLVFLFPLVIGIGNGKLIADTVEKMKIRQPSQVVILSILSAVAIYGMLHYGRYAGFVVSVSAEISADKSETLEAENLSVAKVFLDYAMTEETGLPGFAGYMIYKANEGVSIGRLSRSSSFNLGPVLTWLYWILEFAIILGVTVQKGRKMISALFCESCGNWYGGEKHLGGTAFANESFLMDLIRQKDFSGLGKLMEKNAELPSLEVYFQGCQVCGKSKSQLVVRRAFQSAKGMMQFTDAAQTSLPPTESALLLSQLSFSGD